MRWQNNCPKEQQISVEPGFYTMTFFSDPPASEMELILSDEEFDNWMDQPRVIYVFINKVEAMPGREYKGVPYLYWAYDKE